MHPNYYFSPLAVAIALAISSPIKAAEALYLQKESVTKLQKNFQFLHAAELKKYTHTENSLVYLGQHKDANQISHQRMEQYYKGFLVYGGYAILHGKSLQNTQEPNAVTMNGTIFTGLDKDLGAQPPNFIINQNKVLAHFKNLYAHENLSEEKIIPLVYMDDNHIAHWAYKVSVLVTYKHKIPARPTAILDAKTLTPYIQWNDMKTRTPAKGIGFGGNKKIGTFKYGTDYPSLQISRNRKSQMCTMENTEVKVVDMLHKYAGDNKAMAFACKECVKDKPGFFYTGYKADGYDQENGAASPSNDALYAGYVIKHMYHDWYGLEVLKQPDGTPMQLVMRVHYGEGYENAYWDGKQMTFGDGDTMMYPLVSLGVGAHEVSHGFTEQHSNLEYYGQSGGMNESFSDMAAQAAEFYSVKKSSWQIGYEIMKESSGYEALRYMDKPSRDGSSIDTADDYYGGLDVHYSSGVYNHFFYLLSTMPDWDTRKAFDVMVKANMDYWTPYSSFEDGGCGVLKAARDLKFPIDDVKKALTEVAVDFDACVLSGAS